ncbi:hypothetical protein KCP77_23820 [Salmonella enterica subsp. enterica]|nr:hypothetical protein KCP77_23820 [Salmonella enterica subsp. enterica]
MFVTVLPELRGWLSLNTGTQPRSVLSKAVIAKLRPDASCVNCLCNTAQNSVSYGSSRQRKRWHYCHRQYSRSPYKRPIAALSLLPPSPHPSGEKRRSAHNRCQAFWRVAISLPPKGD